MPITYGKDDSPLITTELQGHKCTLAVRIGGRHSLFLRQESLDQIDKTPCGTIEWRGRGGHTREASAYSIQKLKIGDLELKNVVAAQSDEDDYGILGKFLGEEFNVLLDFPNNRIIACDAFSKLKAKKFVQKDWLCVPFEMHRSGVLLNAKTDLGSCRLVINTTCPVTCLRSSLLSPEQLLMFSSLILGGEQFGNALFESINLPESLQDIDGFIGMDFLKEHPIYLDYKRKVAYIEPPERYLEQIPILFSSIGRPMIKASIEGNFYSLELDLGSGIPFSLSQEILQKINKTEYGYIKWYDFRGERYESSTYEVPEIKINSLKFTHSIVGQESEDFHRNTTIEGIPLQPIGTIGLPILHKYNLFLDFPHSIIYACTDHLTLQKAGLLSSNLLRVPFTFSDRIILSVEMDEGTYRLILDTGATGTVMRGPFPCSTTKFQMMGHDFGKRFIREVNIASNFDFDGALGMDFLREYPIFIDYVNKVLYIDLIPK